MSCLRNAKGRPSGVYGKNAEGLSGNVRVDVQYEKALCRCRLFIEGKVPSLAREMSVTESGARKMEGQVHSI